MRGHRLKFLLLFSLLTAVTVTAQNGTFRVGEKLSYTLSFGSFKDGGYAELYAASRGKIGGREAVEIRSRMKTIGVVSASFMLIDQSRTVFADPATGLPVFIKRIEKNGPIPREVASNFLNAPATDLDLVTLIYKLRESGGNGTYTFSEGDQVYTVTFRTAGSEHLKTDAGDFDTTVVAVQSEYLAMRGIRDMRVDLSSDDAKIPVLLRFKAQKTEFRATLSAVALDQPVAGADPTATPVPNTSPTPIPIPTPRPAPTPLPYVNNEPLLSELGFRLGERLSYRLLQNDQPLATMAFEVGERKQIDGRDTLLLSATVTGVDRPNPLLRPGDTLLAQVEPETLAPRSTEGRFAGGLAVLNQAATFDQRTGVSFGGKTVDAPVGTHSLLSLFYAMRSFNLQFSRDNNNPTNDTRVAVFWGDRPYIFTLRPSAVADITLNGRKVPAQLIAVNTGNPQLDALNIKVWLAADTRVPVRMSAGTYQLDLLPNQ